MTRRRRWTSEELDVLYRHYPKHGATYVARRLGRTPNAVRIKAGSEGLHVGFIPGRITLTELAASTGRARNHLYRTASDAGVLEARGGVASVPEAWAIEYERDLNAKRDADALAGTWYQPAEAAKELGLHPSTVKRALRGKGSAYFLLHDATIREGRNGRRYISPESVASAKHALRTLRSWMTYEDVARTWGCEPTQLSRRPAPRVAALLDRVDSSYVPVNGHRRVFNPKHVHALTAEAHRILGHAEEAVA